MAERECLNICFDDYKKEGVYIILPDKNRLDLTKDNIEKLASVYWKDPNKIPDNIKEAVDFEKCYFCPRKGKKDICDAIRPVLPLLEIVDKFVSYDEVTAVYKGSRELLQVVDTTIQEALKYVSILSLINYHQTNRKYWKYYCGINPVMADREVITKIYLNIYWLHKGNMEEVKKIIAHFNEELRVSTDNQVKRLNLICKNDAFVNAFVNTQIITEFLSVGVEDILSQSFDAHENKITDLS